MKINKRGAFTFIEILVVIAVIAVLALAVVYFINPSQLESQEKDFTRVSDLSTLNQSLSIYHEIHPSGSLGIPGIIYTSIPDPNATTTAGTDCSGIGFVSSTYHCAASSTYRLTNGTGWIPVNFASNTALLPTLPIDPINTTSSGEFYAYVTDGIHYEILANPQAQKTISGSVSSSYIQGSSLTLLNSFPIICINNLNGRGTASTSLQPARIDLTWTNNVPNATEFNIFIATTTGGPYTQVLYNGGVTTQTAFSIQSGLISGTTYYFVVNPFNSFNSNICQSNQAVVAIPNPR